MMGRQDEPERLFYEFRLESHVPRDHLLRGIDAVFDFSATRKSLDPYYSSTGRPSIDPELMIRMLLIGYCFGIRSERRLCEEVHLNLAYRWFCRLGLEGAVPDHSTFSKNRHGRFRESELFRRVFEEVVRACMKAGLVGGEGFAIDASVIEADASRNHRIEGKLTAAPADAAATRPVREYLEALDKSAATETAKSADDGDDAPRGNPPAEPKYTSLTDPAAAWTNKGQMKALFAYGTNYLIDTKAAVIVDVEATPARWSAEVAATKTMLTRTQESFGLTPETLAADAAYGSGLMLGWLMRRGIEPHIPILDREHQTKGYFTRADFYFRCDGERLHLSGREEAPEQRPGARRWDHALSRQHQGLPGMRVEGALHEGGFAHRDAQSLRGRTRTCARTEGNAAVQALVAAAKKGRDVFRASQAQPQLPPAATARIERRERRIPARRRRAELAKAHPLPRPGTPDRTVVCRVSVRSVEECLPGLRREEKSGIVLATQSAPTIPIGEKSRQRRVFQRHP